MTTTTTTSNGLFKLSDPKHIIDLRYVTFTTWGDGDVLIMYCHSLPWVMQRDPRDKLLDLWSSPQYIDIEPDPPKSLVKLPNDVDGSRFVPTPLARQVWDRLVELGWEVTT